MNHTFILICTTVVVVALLTTYGLAPVLWDAAGYVEDVLNHAYRIEFTQVVP